tara:strand:- start:7935 stop:8768 length:834 start_codon:yes stop_codon:yes gene_type:complete
MEYKEITLKDVDTKSLLGNYASVDDVGIICSEPTVFTLDGEPVVIYQPETGVDVEPLRKAMDTVTWNTSTRTTIKYAMKSTCKIFGYQPRINMRNMPCNVAALGLQHPQMHQFLCEWTEVVTQIYNELAPVAAKAHKEKTDELIESRFHLADSMFTSGIVNKTSQMPYHFDRGNFVGAWSAMLGLKKWIDGGFLVIPEYDLALEISDGSMTLFDGQSRLHGVSPIKKLNDGGERYTIVWYSLEKMWECLTTEQEIQFWNKRASELANKKSKEIDDRN